MSIYNDIFYIIIIENMNFIIRNLGWILLIIFFVFMLYLISNQNNTKDVNTLTWTWVAIEQSELVEEIVENKEEETGEEPMVEIKKEVEPIVEEKVEVIKITEGTSDVSDEKDVLNIVDGEDTSAEINSLTEITSTGGMMNSIRNFFTIKKIETSTGTTLTWSVWVDEELIEEVENELSTTWEVITEVEVKEEIKEDTKDVIVAIKEIEQKKEESKSLFDFGFWKKDVKEEIKEETINKEEEINKDSSKEWEDNKKEMKEDKTVTSEKKNEVKSSVQASEDSLATYEIWVKSMYLNNAWFTKRTGILYKWDTVEQLTATNKYGCFQVKVLSSSNAVSNGKIAWACEYYMVGHQASLSSYKKAANQYYNNMNARSNKVTTYKTTHKAAPKKTSIVASNQLTSVSKVWTMHSVKTHSLKLNNASFTQTEAYLLKGDKVEQITNTNSSGCFKVSVFSSSNASWNAKGKTGWVCQKYLK